ncbi:MAG: hypothetical protein E5Y67_03460 [Mesorhizobium sp.]|uniref:helix-turn-helix domain-containing protein n=1 Tax=Mesorhizobium sp. TaxID=1871066 RepID=UPI001229E1D7|nr:helix-turn-helix domain-containing protein [Mesorhizobium sp.]TIM16264.1 MAG: hypothetical protein E5Y67_03460 [Mesorhizobium sp.]
MSAFLLGIGFRADMGTCARKLVLLKLIDACDDDGSRIFPAISTIARAAQCSTRQVQRELKAFLDIGLIRLVREGGKGPRSTNEYALDLDVLQLLGKGGWALVASEKRPDAAAEKGDTVSPLDGAEKGDTGSTERVTPETSKGDKLSHPTPPDPSFDPSVEREREREDGKKKIDADGWALLKDWPGFAGMPKEPALKVWRSLETDERAEAARLFPHWLALLKAQRKTHTPAPSTYFGQKLWREVPEPPEAAPKPAYAPAFGPVWAAIRMRDLVTGPKALPSPLKGWEESAIANGRLEREALEKGNRMRSGWPMVNALHQAAETRGLGIHGFGPDEERLGKLCEFVPVGSDVWKAWKIEHEMRGWPWLPDPGTMRGVYFPAGGPAGLEAFEQAVRGTNDAQQAAE